MRDSFVNVAKRVPFSANFEAYIIGYLDAYPDQWQDLFQGEGSMTVVEVSPVNDGIDVATFRFEWGTARRKRELKAFRKEQLYKGNAVYDLPQSNRGKRVVIAYSERHSALDAMKCLERVIRRIHREGALIRRSEDGEHMWEARNNTWDCAGIVEKIEL